MNTTDTTSFSPLFATRPAATPAVHDLGDFNSAPAEQLTTLLTFMTTCRELARTVVVGRPYRSAADVYAAASRALHTLPTPLVTDIVNVHRPIDRVPLIEDAARRGLLSEDRLAELREDALGYAAVQGHLFIADPAVWGSPQAVAMIPLPDGATVPPVDDIVTGLLADLDRRTLLPPADAWRLTISHLEESNRQKLVTLLESAD
jgi:hypothetical protein